MRRARVIAHTVHADGSVGVEVLCPNGCKRSRRVDSRPLTHFHGWDDRQLERSPHCNRRGSESYVLWWPDKPADLERVPA